MKKYSFPLLMTVHFLSQDLVAQMDGTLDDMFNNGGIVTTSLGTANALANAIAIQADGKIVLSGSANNGNNNDFNIVRYLEDGTLDTDFNGTGKLQIDFNAADDFAEGIAVRLSDKKIIVGGYAFNGLDFDFAVAQYLEDGTPDPSFGNNGKVTSPLSTTAFCKAITLQDDGKIIAAGYSSNQTNRFTIMRYLEDGSLDQSFDDEGIVITPVGVSSSVANCVMMQPDDKILVAGQSFNESTFRWEAALVRYNTNGSLDNTFDQDGMITTAAGNKDVTINAIARDTDGKIILAGYTGTSPSNNNFTLFRYLPDGRLDSMFGIHGVLTTPFNEFNNQANALLVQPDHKMIVGGNAAISGPDHFALARYDANGTLDPTFGDQGTMGTFVGNFDVINSMAFDRQGRILAAGSSFNGTNFQYAAARYLNDLETGSIELPMPRLNISVRPNPITESFALHFTLESEVTISVYLMDMQGRNVATFVQHAKMYPGDQSFEYRFPPSLPGGNYILQAITSTGTTSIQVSH